MADTRLIRKTGVSKFYRAWVNMKSRCGNNKIKDFFRYGGRGIKVCKKWETFDGFIDDMLPCYKENLTLDRIDNNKGYCKENCRWATPREQANNRRSNYLVNFNNKTQTLEQWARELNINSSTLRQRVYCYKWSVKKALTK